MSNIVAWFSYIAYMQLCFYANLGPQYSYTDLSNLVLEVSVRLCDEQGKQLVPGKKVASVNNLLHSLFKEIGIFVGAQYQKISGAGTYYPYRAYLHNLINVSVEA